jgi:hypothetical protein
VNYEPHNNTQIELAVAIVSVLLLTGLSCRCFVETLGIGLCSVESLRDWRAATEGGPYQPVGL